MENRDARAPRFSYSSIRPRLNHILNAKYRPADSLAVVEIIETSVAVSGCRAGRNGPLPARSLRDRGDAGDGASVMLDDCAFLAVWRLNRDGLRIRARRRKYDSARRYANATGVTARRIGVDCCRRARLRANAGRGWVELASRSCAAGDNRGCGKSRDDSKN